jgi:hypothetical protein
LHRTSSSRNANQSHVKDDVRKGMIRAIYFKCSLEVDLLPFLQIPRKGECKSSHLKEKIHALTSSGLGRGMN